MEEDKKKRHEDSERVTWKQESRAHVGITWTTKEPAR